MHATMYLEREPSLSNSTHPSLYLTCTWWSTWLVCPSLAFHFIKLCPGLNYYWKAKMRKCRPTDTHSGSQPWPWNEMWQVVKSPSFQHFDTADLFSFVSHLSNSWILTFVFWGKSPRNAFVCPRLLFNSILRGGNPRDIHKPWHLESRKWHLDLLKFRKSKF